MKRIHLFEFEDQPWFPEWLRDCLTRMMVVMHRLVNTAEEMTGLVKKGLGHTSADTIIDLCSGSGGPMPEVLENIRKNEPDAGTKLIMTDLYPNLAYARSVNEVKNDHSQYRTEPVDAANVNPDLQGLRTMVGSLHHMKPDTARNILRDAMGARQPFLAFEISDNSFPRALWWIAIPFNVLTSLVASALARPFTWQQGVFTYLIPIIPVTFAWDGAVSNARTYTLNDLDILLDGLESENYTWEKGILKGKTSKIYLLGYPK